MNGIGRFGFAIGFYAVLAALLMYLASFIYEGTFPVAVLLWLGLVAATVKWFLVAVPQQTSLVLVNSLNGSLREVPSGLGIKLPWEHAPLENFLELRTLSAPLDGTHIANDGPVVRVKGVVQFRIKPGAGQAVVAHSEAAFFEGIRQVCASFLSDYIARHSAKDVRRNSHELEQQLLRHLRTDAESLERRLGIEVTLVSLADVAFDERYQQVRTEASVANELVEIASRLRAGAMTEAQALDAAMILSGDVKKQIVDVTGAGLEAVVGRLLAVAEALRTSGRQ